MDGSECCQGGRIQDLVFIWIQIMREKKRVSWMLLLLLLSRFSRVRLCATPSTAAHQAPCPWDSPGKNTGVGCHFLLQCLKVKSESEVTQSCPTLHEPMDCSPPGSSVHGIFFQARVLEWVAIALSLDDARTSVLGSWVYSNVLNQCKEHRRNIPRESERGAPFVTC